MKFCHQCGTRKEDVDNQKFCTQCGTHFVPRSTGAIKKDFSVDSLLDDFNLVPKKNHTPRTSSRRTSIQNQLESTVNKPITSGVSRNPVKPLNRPHSLRSRSQKKYNSGPQNKYVVNRRKPKAKSFDIPDNNSAHVIITSSILSKPVFSQSKSHPKSARGRTTPEKCLTDPPKSNMPSWRHAPSFLKHSNSVSTSISNKCYICEQTSIQSLHCTKCHQKVCKRHSEDHTDAKGTALCDVCKGLYSLKTVRDKALHFNGVSYDRSVSYDSRDEMGTSSAPIRSHPKPRRRVPNPGLKRVPTAPTSLESSKSPKSPKSDCFLSKSQSSRGMLSHLKRSEAGLSSSSESLQEYISAQQEKEPHRKRLSALSPTRKKKQLEGEIDYCGVIQAGINHCLQKAMENIKNNVEAKDDFLFKDLHTGLEADGIQFDIQDYAPSKFIKLREQQYVDKQYSQSLIVEGIKGGATGAGKSGMLFFFSKDGKFVIKTISRPELKFFRKILERYLQHAKQYPHTFMSRFYALHKVVLPNEKRIRFVIMNNVFETTKCIHEKFDLKGSTRNRVVPDEEIEESAVLKDLNFSGHTIYFGKTQKAAVISQLHKDCLMLVDCQIMDFSLLLGVHHGSTPGTQVDEISADMIKKPLDRRKKASVFQKYEGGIASFRDGKPTGDIYYLGIIDILQEFNLKKKLESTYKSIKYDADQISAVEATKYADRFQEFLISRME